MATIKRLKLKELREDYKIDRGDLAERAGFSKNFLSMVEKGRRGASDKLRQVLIDQFHVDNLEDYEIEVETDDVNGFSFDNHGQLNNGQKGGTAAYYDFKGQDLQTNPATLTSSKPTTLDVMTSVVNDYLNKNQELQRDKDKLNEELSEAKKKIEELESTVLSLQNKLDRLSKK